MLLKTTFTWQPTDRGLGENGGGRVHHIIGGVLASNLSKAALWGLANTLVVAVGTVVMVVAIGGLLAWLVTRTDLPMRKFISTWPFALHPTLMDYALAWVQTFQNSKMYMPKGFLEYLLV